MSPIINPKILEKPQVWGIYGDWRDLNDKEGKDLLAKYNKQMIEYCNDVDEAERWR